jgi:endo-1,4-beta-D-glucanase Y
MNTASKRVGLLASALLVFVHCGASADEPPSAWPEWEQFLKRFVQDDGRVIDVTFDQKSTSEGQAYAMFFALVANQQQRFDTLLKWTSDNLADGQLGAKPPGWLWGKRDDGGWGIKDRNPASDADLWMAYTLLEASRLWHDPRYEVIGRTLLKHIAEHDVVRAGSAGTIMLPGPVGFALAQDRYRINPSYLPGFIFAYLHKVDSGGPWDAVWADYLKLAPKIFSSGVAPDNLVVSTKGEVLPDTEREPLGSYDAIRVYLWAGMSGENSKEIVRLLTPYAKLVRATGKPPEKVNPIDGKPRMAVYSPVGFAGALLPFCAALGDEESSKALKKIIATENEQAKSGKPTNYYDQALILFGKGWDDGYYKFDADGRLLPRWK